MIGRPTDRRIDQINFAPNRRQSVARRFSGQPQPQGGGFMSGMNNAAKLMNYTNKMSGGRLASGIKGLANKGLSAAGLPTFSMPTSTAAPYAANSSQAAGELARAAQSAGYAPEYGIQGVSPVKQSGGMLSGLFGSAPISSAAPIAANASPAASEMALAAQSAGYAPEFGLAGAGATGAGAAAAPTASSIASGATSMGAPAASLAAAESAQAAAPAVGGGMMSSSAIPVLGWIATFAQIGNQMSQATDREFEGHQSGDPLTGDFMTDPFPAWLGAELKEPTGGEAFSAAMARGDKSDAMKRLPSALHDFALPGFNVGARWVGENRSESAGKWLDPVGYMFRSLW
jgi:hypothetical protein